MNLGVIAGVDDRREWDTAVGPAAELLCMGGHNRLHQQGERHDSVPCRCRRVRVFLRQPCGEGSRRVTSSNVRPKPYTRCRGLCVFAFKDTLIAAPVLNIDEKSS